MCGFARYGLLCGAVLHGKLTRWHCTLTMKRTVPPLEKNIRSDSTVPSTVPIDKIIHDRHAEEGLIMYQYNFQIILLLVISECVDNSFMV